VSSDERSGLAELVQLEMEARPGVTGPFSNEYITPRAPEISIEQQLHCRRPLVSTYLWGHVCQPPGRWFCTFFAQL